MKSGIKKAPASRREQGAVVQPRCKYTKNSWNDKRIRVEFQGVAVYLGRVQYRVWSLFLSGKKLTGADISHLARVTDPRGHIAALRNKGLPISAIWVSTADATRCKRYYLDYEK
jgi:hypothetical protein